MAEGCEMMMRLAREAGFQDVTRVPTDGQPGVFATLDAGAPRTRRPLLHVRREAGGPRRVVVAALGCRARRQAGLRQGGDGPRRGEPEGTAGGASWRRCTPSAARARKLPVNLVLVAEGEEEIGSPHFSQVVQRPEVAAALKRCSGVFMPSAAQDPDGGVTVSLGAKGVVELELVASGEKWGRGPRKDVHSSNRARLDSPAFHLVQALATLVTADGDPAIDGFADAARPASAAREGHARRGGRAARRGHAPSSCSRPSAGPTTCPGARRWSGSCSRPP